MENHPNLVADLIRALESLKKSHWRPEVEMPITPSEMNLLLNLYHHCDPDRAGLQPSELGELLQISRPTVTSLVNSLESQGYVERRHDKVDRRAVLVCLTPKGRHFVDVGRTIFENHMRSLVNFLGVDDAQELIRLIRRVQLFNEVRKH